MKIDKKKISWWINLVLSFILAIGLGRVFFLTVVLGDYYRGVAKSNITRVEKEVIKRGLILDRSNKQLAVNVEVGGKTVRYYPFGEVFAGVVGYLGRTEGDNWGGVMGLESSYQEKLIGEGTGENLVTNLDANLQKQAFIILKEKLKEVGKSGAIVISTVKGEILTMVSAPSFDNNLFVDGGKRSDFGGDYKSVADLIKDEEKKLFQQYESAVRTMTTSQGRLLLKLIARETSKTGYEIIKDYRGALPATFWYSVGKIFGTDLKSEFHKEQEDSVIENILSKYNNNDLY